MVPYLTPGLYGVLIERSGFKPVEQRDIRVRLGQRVELDYTLDLGKREELVDVTGHAARPSARSRLSLASRASRLRIARISSSSSVESSSTGRRSGIEQ